MFEFQKNAAKQQYQILENAQVIGHIDYEVVADGVVDLPHTHIDPQHGGKGLGGQLVAYALADLRAHQQRAIPTCSFIASYMDKHPEVADLRAT